MNTQTQQTAFTRYLAAKRTVDDRALNQFVYAAMSKAVASLGAYRPLRVLEVGCGIGTMVERLTEWGFLAVLPIGSRYTAIDADATNTSEAVRRVAKLNNVTIEFEETALKEFSQRESAIGAHDLVIAHALLDLLDLDVALPALHDTLRPGGLGWFTINFDSVTHFEPQIDSMFDLKIEALYHQTMDMRQTAGRPSGDSRTGRRLLTGLPGAGFEILAAGASDWVVHPVGGGYLADEAWFLHFIVDTLQSALNTHSALKAARFDAWIAARHSQIEACSLSFIAHQLDFLVRRAPAHMMEAA